jgi:protein O-GlcNAc transferase
MAMQTLASAVTMFQEGRMSAAELASLHRRWAETLLADNRAAEAARVLREALVLEPGSTRAHNNLGQALMRLGEMRQAIECYENAARLDPGYAIARANLGLALWRCGELDRAAESLSSALALARGLIPAWLNLGAIRTEQLRFAEALQCFETALSLKPLEAAALMGKSAVLRALGRRAEALHALEQAIAQEPSNVDAWCNRGVLLHELAEVEPAAQAFRRALEIDPQCVQARTRLLARLIPAVPSNEYEAARGYDAFQRELEQLLAWLDARELDAQQALLAAQQQLFYLSYEERSNKPLLTAYRRASAARLAALPSTATTGTHAATRVIPSGDWAARFRLGFVSAYVFDHSVHNALLKGWLEQLDRTRLEICVFSIRPRRDALSDDAKGASDLFVSGARSAHDWAHTLRGHELDAIIFPEIGMNETTLALASMRHAPRQFAAWGHPETSGLPTIDEFLSADLFEPADAQEHYSERLVRLPNLGVHYQPYRTAPASLDPEACGILATGPVLMCAGVPWKYRPQDDWILVEIARRVRNCQFVFFQHELAAQSGKLEARLIAAFRAAGLDPSHHLVAIPWQPRAEFFALLRHADVYLDTVGFSGFNGMMQAVECHLPCVSYAGRFMRGRFGSAILGRLGLGEWVAADRAAYVDLAVRLATSASCREAVRRHLREAESVLYADQQAVSALTGVLLGEERPRAYTAG